MRRCGLNFSNFAKADGLRITLPECYEVEIRHLGTGHDRLRCEYTLWTPTGDVLFHDYDYCPSPLHPWFSKAAFWALLSFLTLVPGDTDAEYFERYTPDQLEWANACAEYLGYVWGAWLAEDGEDEEED